jgi:pilus assembly protein CpaE
VAGEQIRLLIIEDVPQVASHMRSLLTAQTQIKTLDVLGEGERAAESVAELKPHVVIVDALLQGKVKGLHVAEAIRRTQPQVGIIVLTVPQNPVREAPQKGIDAVLTMPFTGFDLTTLIRRMFEERSAEAARGRSAMVSLFSPKGGVGRTTLAYNLAVALGASRKVVLVDGSFQFSDLRGLLRVPPTAPSILNLPTDRIRDSDIGEVVWRDPSGIDVLLAPPRVEMAEMVTLADVEKALSMLRQMYDFVIVDTRAALNEDVLVFLDAADTILQVLTYDTMAIRGLVMAGEAFQAIGYPPTKLQTVLNRADANGGMNRSDLEQLLGARIDYEVVSDGRLVLMANNEGVPFIASSPDALISIGVRKIAESLASRAGVAAPAAAARR